MRDDPIVEEVRRIRAEYLEQCGNDLGKLVEDLSAWERAHPERVVSYPPKAPGAQRSA